MASINSFRIDVDRIKAGEWVDVKADDGTYFSLKVRGYTQRYQDLLAALQHEAVARLNRFISQPPFFEVATLPLSETNKCLGEALATEVFLDVAKLTEEDGMTATTAEQFAERLRNPEEWAPLIVFVLGAAGSITRRRDVKVAEMGNSLAPHSETN